MEYINRDLINSANHLIRDLVLFLNIYLFFFLDEKTSSSVNAVLNELYFWDCIFITKTHSPIA